ncbi:MAG: mannose-1-phosphate guanylyltransferase/mannose-6-phosphate isomerase [Gammaproteobacteria bacterium]
MTTLFPIILAGGGGTRLWPLSREQYPKQFLRLGSAATLLQQTLRRLDGLTSMPSSVAHSLTLVRPIVVCNEDHRFLVTEQARQVGVEPSSIMLEPVGRNTAPALTCAALVCQARGPEGVVLMMPADHVIQNPEAFCRAVLRGTGLAQNDYLVTFGVTPTYAETGYGYIECGTEICASGEEIAAHKAYHLVAFAEKPDAERAQSYISAGNYLWNSGIFMMKASQWLQAIGHYRPDILAACERACGEAQRDGGFYRMQRQAFESCPSESIDYAVMEKVAAGSRAAIVPLDAGWSDVGAWSSLWDIAGRDSDGNAVIGDVCAIEARNNLLLSESRLLAVLGCDELVVVETVDAVLVLPKDKAQGVKQVIAWLREHAREERVNHRRVYRPWGSYESIDQGERFQVKRIVVQPGAKLSLQMHHHRAEHWIVVKGTARVTRGEEEFLLTENQSTYIPLGVQHRLENPGTIPLEIIEVQSGAYLGEDDIVRFADAYQRV